MDHILLKLKYDDDSFKANTAEGQPAGSQGLYRPNRDNMMRDNTCEHIKAKYHWQIS